MLEFNGREPTSPPELLAYWIHEREAVRLKKEAGQPKPWSDDLVFQNTYFCNVRREDDKVTRWLRTHWLVQDRNYEFAMVMARLINKPQTLERIGFPYSFRGFADIEFSILLTANTCKSDRTPFWGNAYLVSTHGQAMGKVQYLIGALERAHKVLPLAGVAGTCAAYHRALKTLEGFSDFMAAQVVADLKNTSFHPLALAPDWHTFAAPGPGSLRGMEWYFGAKVSKKDFADCLAEIRNGLADMGCEIIHDICNQDLQNCLCEFDKFMRVRTGTGRSKRKYNGYR